MNKEVFVSEACYEPGQKSGLEEGFLSWNENSQT